MLRWLEVLANTEGDSSGVQLAVCRSCNIIRSFPGISCTVASVRVDKAFMSGGVMVEPVGEQDLLDYDVIIINGIFDLKFIAFAFKCKNMGVPYLVKPHGSLVRCALRYGAIRKRLFLYFSGLLRNSHGLVFLSEDERVSSGYSRTSGVIQSNFVPTRFFEFKFVEKENLFLYIGRFDIHHKGLDILMAAVSKAAVVMRKRGWSMILRGTDYRDGKRWLLNEVAKRGIEDIVTIGGPIYGDAKKHLLRRSKVFVHTSRYEGQPQAVMEAMASGCACLISRGANLSTVFEERNLGILVDSTVSSTSEGLCDLMRDVLSVDEAGNNARAFAMSEWGERDVVLRNLEALRKYVRDLSGN